MSDPIRSISQNNFLLAAQQEVSHDNTLSGNGTEASPLGLNETVLWEGDGTGSSNVTLSESMANFEMLRILVGNVDASDGLEYKYFNNDPQKLKHIMYMAGGTGNAYYVCNLMSCTNTTLTVTNNVNVIRPYVSDAVTGSRNVDNYARCIHEVVGINRIANN